MKTRSVIVAGRPPSLLLSLKRILEPSLEVAAMTDNVLSLVDALKDMAPDLLVLEISCSEFGAPDLAQRLQERYPGLRVVLIGNDERDPWSPARPDTTYVCKHSADQALLPAARDLLAPPGMAPQTMW